MQGTVTHWPTLTNATGRPQQLEWEELFDQFSVRVPYKHDLHGGWSPAIFEGNKRGRQSVRRVFAIVLDVDGGWNLDAAREAFAKLYGLIHTSKRHSAEVHRFRVILPLGRSVSAFEYEAIWRRVDARWPGKFDPQAKDASRFWYLPGVLDDEAPFEVIRLTGKALDPEAMLAEPEPVQAQPTQHQDRPHTSIEQRARAYLDRMPPAISGSGGHKALWAAAVVLARGFDLPEARVLELLRTDYNSRCKPPWSEKELRHKAAHASRAKLPRGYLLRDEDAEEPAPDPPPWCDDDRDEVEDEEREAIADEKLADEDLPPEAFMDPAPAKPQATTGAIDNAWKPLPSDILTSPPPVRRWLLRHPSEGSLGGLGDGLLPRGKAGLLVADGGIGKTMTLVALAVSVVTGHPWLGHFMIDTEARNGRVLLALAEEDMEEVHRRMWTVADAYRLSDEERALVTQRLIVLPLAGRPVSLLSYGPDGRSRLDSTELASLRRNLKKDAGETGWSLIALDPLARWGDDESERDNAAATRLMQACESLVDAPGNPTVLLAHHASQVAVASGSVTSRGVTGIRNGARWEATFRAAENGDVFFRQTKSNYSRPMLEELQLLRGAGGLPRVPTAVELEEREAEVEERNQAEMAEQIERVVAALRGMVTASRVDDIVRAAGMNLGRGRTAVRMAITKKKIVRTGPTKDPTYTVAP